MSLLCASFVPINVWSSFVSLCLSLSLSFLFFFLKLGNKKRSLKKLPFKKLGHDSENGLSAEWLSYVFGWGRPLFDCDPSACPVA